MIFAGNWKLNLGPKAVAEFFKDLKTKNLDKKTLEQIFFFPQNLSVVEAVKHNSDLGVNLGVQNIADQKSGAFTGENSLEVAAELGLSHCLIGHSERRSLYGEDLKQISLKMSLCVNSPIVPILCIGETLEERDSGRTFEVLAEQLKTALHDVPDRKDFILAYEPVWAIGTGKVASPEMAEEAHASIREFLAERYDMEKAEKTSILYGGSVKPESAEGLSAQQNIDGFLIGGASLKVESFLGIIENSSGH